MIAISIALASEPALAVAKAVFTDDRVTVSAPPLAWPSGTTVRVTGDAGELVIRYDRPLAEAWIAALRSANPAAIGDLRWNDDSLVLRAARGWDIDWRQTGTVVAIVFAAPATVSPAEMDAEAPIDAALAAIEADAAAGYVGQARRAAVALVRRRPADPQAARLLADARAADGDLRGAAGGYRALESDDRAARRVIAAAAGTAGIGIVARDGGDLAQAEIGARIDAAIGDRAAVGGGIRRIASRVDTPTGAVRRGDTVADASLTARLTDTVRVQALASAALDDGKDGGRTGGTTGGGVRLTAGSAEAQARATLTRHMPDYSTPAQVLAGGYLSRAALGFTYRLTPGLVGQADLGRNRYGLAGQPGASDTIAASAGLDYGLRRQFPALGLSYRYEAEYVERMRVGANGGALVPLADRENHTVQGVIGGTIGAVQVTGLAGWTVDRFGGNGPTASIGVAAPIGILWRIEGGAGVTSVSRPGFTGTQLFARAQVSRSLGSGR
jgi:hypothetical protein